MPRILKNVDARFAAIVAKRKPSSGKKTDTLAAVVEVCGKQIETLQPNEGMAIKVPAGVEPRKFAAKVRTRLISVSRVEQPLAGYDFKTMLDTETNEVLLMRKENLATPRPKKVGGRKAGTPNKGKLAAMLANSSNVEEPKVDTKATPSTKIKDLTA